MKYKIVELTWHDAWSDSGWKRIEDLADRPLVCSSIGYLIRETTAGYLIAGSIGEGGTFGSTAFRPRNMVKAIKFY